MIGIDEVGRGCLAGPLLVVAARATGELPAGLTDSKTLSKVRREKFSVELTSVCQFGEGWVEPDEIDELGLAEAMRLGVDRALKSLGARYNDAIIMDGNVNYCDPRFGNVECVIKADLSHPIVGAASIHAKVSRDKKMAELSVEYPDYGFDVHVGYGTKTHLDALRRVGVTPLHRRSYKPVRELAKS